MLARCFLALLAPVVALSLAAAPSTAFAADEVGKQGTATGLEVNTPSADAYLQYHGRVFVVISSSVTEEYRWGGTSCGSKTLSAENVDLLAQAVRDGLAIMPRYQTGQGTIRCLVGFSVQKAGK